MLWKLEFYLCEDIELALKNKTFPQSQYCLKHLLHHQSTYTNNIYDHLE